MIAAIGVGGFLAIGMLLLLVAAAYYFITNSTGTMKKPEERKITRIQLPPPPPPPPPPPEPKPKPIEEPKDTPQDPTPQNKTPEPKQQQDAPKLTSAGPVGQDAFGASAGPGGVGNRIGGCSGANCGNGLGGGGGGFGGFGEYNSSMTRVIQKRLKSERRARAPSAYDIVAMVTLDPGSGAIQSAQLEGSTGDSARDRFIETVLIGLRPDREIKELPRRARVSATVRPNVG